MQLLSDSGPSVSARSGTFIPPSQRAFRRTERDASRPDLGFHFEPIDYGLTLFTITNATLLITNGASLALFGDTGIWAQDGTTIISEGSALNHNRFIRSYAVQEQPVCLGSYATSSGLLVNSYNYGNSRPKGSYRFSDFLTLATGGYHFYSDRQWAYTNLTVKDCVLKGGNCYFSGSTNSTTTVINSIFERIYCVAYDSYSAVTLRNNLFKGRYLDVFNWSTNSWVIKDNIFDNVGIDDFSVPTDHGYNAYINCAYRFYPTNSHDVALSSFTYEIGPLSRFYQPTNSALINAGSRNATNAGLYHYTVLTSQVKETNTVVDIGPHFVALDGNGNPVDTDGDGLPDYVEDANGNGSVDTVETSWLTADTDGDGVSDYLEWLLGRSSLISGATNSATQTKLVTYTPLRP